MLKLLDDLRTEADLCRNETADDIADLLDKAAAAIEYLHSENSNMRSLAFYAAQALGNCDTPERWKADEYLTKIIQMPNSLITSGVKNDNQSAK